MLRENPDAHCSVLAALEVAPSFPSLPSKADLSSPSWAFPRAEAGNTGPECLFRPGRAPGRRGGNSHKMFVQVGVRFPTREEEGEPEEPAESAH